jgi:hypothetical protein
MAAGPGCEDIAPSFGSVPSFERLEGERPKLHATIRALGFGFGDLTDAVEF